MSEQIYDDTLSIAMVIIQWMQKSGGNSSTKFESGDFPRGPVGKTLPSNAKGVGSLSGQGAKTPHALRPK